EHDRKDREREERIHHRPGSDDRFEDRFRVRQIGKIAGTDSLREQRRHAEKVVGTIFDGESRRKFSGSRKCAIWSWASNTENVGRLNRGIELNVIAAAAPAIARVTQ